MPDVYFDNPPILQGDERIQLTQLSNYLGILSQKLNEAMMQVSIEEISAAAAEKVRTAEAQGNTASGGGQMDTLKAMIVKTAQIVRHEMDEIKTHLEEDLQALSTEFGTLEENLDATITATARGVLQEYNYEQRVTGLENAAGETDNFVRRTNQYIFSGLIDETNLTYGIAIGENVTAYDSQGNPYLNHNAKSATFTMDRLSFWQGNVEIAYFSNGKFYITDGEIRNSLQIGNFVFKKMADNSMALMSV